MFVSPQIQMLNTECPRKGGLGRRKEGRPGAEEKQFEYCSREDWPMQGKRMIRVMWHRFVHIHLEAMEINI